MKILLPKIVEMSKQSLNYDLMIAARSALLQLCSCEKNLILCKELGGFELLISLFTSWKTPEQKQTVLDTCHRMSIKCEKVNLYELYLTIVETVVNLLSDWEEMIVEKALACLKLLVMRIDLQEVIIEKGALSPLLSLFTLPKYTENSIIVLCILTNHRNN
jgi:hypothetical protein